MKVVKEEGMEGKETPRKEVEALPVVTPTKQPETVNDSQPEPTMEQSPTVFYIEPQGIEAINAVIIAGQRAVKEDIIDFEKAYFKLIIAVTSSIKSK